MTFGEIVELIFGFAMLAFILYFIIVVPIIFIQDAGKPRKRRRRKPTNRRYKPYSYSLPDFDYYHSYNKTEFLVYFIENESLDALKIGVGSGGRLLQLLNSYQDKSEQSDSVGWKLLRLAKFSDYENNYDLGKIYANEAEKKAHFYWRNVLKLPIHLKDFQMGYSKVRNYGDINWTLTKGYTETVDRSKVCEVSTWNYVINSYGFIEEHNAFMGYEPRELKLLHQNHSTLNEPLDYEAFKLKQVHHYYEKDSTTSEKRSAEERFWAKVDKNGSGCWQWMGAKTNSKYEYGLFNFLDNLNMAHKIAWILEGNEDLGNSLLDNVCGNRSCVKPEHWKRSNRTFSIDGKPKISNFKCTNEGCDRPSTAIHKSALCEPCKQKAKRLRRKNRTEESDQRTNLTPTSKNLESETLETKPLGVISVYPCKTKDCQWPSSSMFEKSYCEKCRIKISEDN
jgi:hypothetical protein